ncbi:MULTISPECIES: hypothetical protein [unclassified Aminobacter]|uniref:hypothetical protein n=1 Tax=unclassified Aminobacter TaxID=2644704 RepID=UPI000463A2A9|nr:MULTISPECIES: hypothetical protein [unclassified Aminobacter]TWG53697.1 O-antigen/teichoic acid export membrane protein [Aminobacter sp. J44]TWH27521.1 O-antigen/teichoic acid export membrane protein [Aminobacter sp. J15]
MNARAEVAEIATAPRARNVETRLNLAANYLNFIVAALAGLIINPLLLGALGTSGFGIWKASQRIVELVLSCDGGPPQALKWLVANCRGDGAEKRRLVGAALRVWLHWLPPVVVLSAVLAWLLPPIIEDGDAGGAELTALCLILCASSILVGIAALPAAALVGENKSWLAVSVTTASVILSSTAVIAAAQAGLSLIGMAGAALAVTLLQLVATILAARWRLPWWGVAQSISTEARHVARLGAATLVWSYVQKLLLSSELLLVSVLVGAGAVSQYVFTGFAAQFVPQLILLTTSAFMPRLGRALARGEGAEAARLIRATGEINFAIVALSGAAILAFNDAFVGRWAGEAQYLGSLVNALIVASAIQIAHLRWHAQLQDAALAMRARSRLALVGSCAGIAMATIVWWLSGSIAGMFAGLIAGRLFLSLRISRLSRRSIDASAWIMIGNKAKLTAVTLVAGLVAGEFLHAAPYYLALGAVVVPVLAAFSWWFILSADTRVLVSELFPFARSGG